MKLNTNIISTKTSNLENSLNRLRNNLKIVKLQSPSLLSSLEIDSPTSVLSSNENVCNSGNMNMSGNGEYSLNTDQSNESSNEKNIQNTNDDGNNFKKRKKDKVKRLTPSMITKSLTGSLITLKTFPKNAVNEPQIKLTPEYEIKSEMAEVDENFHANSFIIRETDNSQLQDSTTNEKSQNNTLPELNLSETNQQINERETKTTETEQPLAKRIIRSTNQSITTDSNQLMNEPEKKNSPASETLSTKKVSSISITNLRPRRNLTLQNADENKETNNISIRSKSSQNQNEVIKTLDKANFDIKLSKTIKRINKRKPIETGNKIVSLLIKKVNLTSDKQKDHLNNENMHVDQETSENDISNLSGREILSSKVHLISESASKSELNQTIASQSTSLNHNRSMIDLLKQEKLGNYSKPGSCDNSRASFPDSNQTVDLDQLRHLSYKSALKLNYLNIIGILNDCMYDYMLETLPVCNYNLGNEIKLIDSKRVKNLLNKQMIDYVDSQITSRTISSPIYSLTLQTDNSFTAIYVYIKFLDHTLLRNNSDTECNTIEKTHLIKLFDLKQIQQQLSINFHLKERSKSNGLNAIKLSKYLFEQLKVNVINQFKLNKQNLMCVSIETKILEHLCFSTLQLYLSDLMNSFILIIPHFKASKMMNIMLNEWNAEGNKCSIKDYFKIFTNIIKYLEMTNSKDFFENFDFALIFDSLEEFALMNNLNEFIKITELIYTNYSRLVCKLKTSQQDEQLEAKRVILYDQINSVDYYFMTCLLCDLFKFLDDYRANPKRFSSMNDLVLPWELNGSYLKNLLTEQLSENCDKSSASLNDTIQRKILMNRSLCDENTANDKETIEFEDNSLDYLIKMKDSIEKFILNMLDFCSEKSENKENFSYLTTSGSIVDTNGIGFNPQISMLDLYSFLNQMFDVSYKNIRNKDEKFFVKLALNDKQLQNILDYYEFCNLVTIEKITEEYKTFFREYFELTSQDLYNEMSAELINDLNNSKNLETINHLGIFTRSLLEPNTKLREKFIKFVYQCNQKKTCPVISFLATIYLCIPSIVDFDDEIKINKKLMNKKELVNFENKLKLLDSIQTPVSSDNCYIKLEEVPYIDLNFK